MVIDRLVKATWNGSIERKKQADEAFVKEGRPPGLMPFKESDIR
jgi:hypothetical protein